MMMQSRNIDMKACRRIVLLLVVAACTLGWIHGLGARPKPAEKNGVTRATALRAREVDLANLVRREQVERLTRDPQIQVFRRMDTQRIATFFNQRKAAFQDVRVRRAVLEYGMDRHAISKTALLGLAQPLWSFVPPGSRGHLDFAEQFPYDPGKARALLKEAGYDEKNPLRYTIMTHGAEASLATIATSIKTQYAKIGVEVTVEVLDRPIFLRRLTRDRDWDQVVVNVSAAIDPYTISQALDTRAGSNVSARVVAPRARPRHPPRGSQGDAPGSCDRGGLASLPAPPSRSVPGLRPRP
jgi:ABC-type transport system substrate-binding protein